MAAADITGVVPRIGPAARFPHNADAEMSILGGIILKNEALGLLEDIETEDFFDLKHKVVFQAIRNLAAADRPIDVVTLEDEIEKQGRLEAIGGISFLGELCLRVPTIDNVVAYAEIVKGHRRNRDAIVSLSSALHRAQNWAHDPAELVAEQHQQHQRQSGLRRQKRLEPEAGQHPGQ